MLAHDWFDRPLPPNVIVGEGSWLHSTFAFLHYRSRQPIGVRIGSHTGVYKGTHFDLGPNGQVIIGDYCSIVSAIVATDRRVEIGDYAFIAHEVVIADDPWAQPFDPTAATPADPAAQGIHIGAKVWIGARAILLGKARVGEGAIVGAASIVDSDVRPYSIVAGNPARVVGDARTRAGARDVARSTRRP
jgi:acetyltransferase-like isoleucine patch superfamily enzyme